MFSFLGSLFFLLGSIVYVIASVNEYNNNNNNNNNSDFLYLLGAVVFVVDSFFYIVSGYQLRSEVFEIPFLKRKNIFFIELICS